MPRRVALMGDRASARVEQARCARRQIVGAASEALHGIRARGKRRFRVATTDSRPMLPVALTLKERNFSPSRPDPAWSGDITYIGTMRAGCFWPW